MGSSFTRTRRAQPAAYEARKAIVGSAERINLNRKNEAEDIRRRVSLSQGWQKDAWTYYDGIGEIKFAYGLTANVVSRIRLYVGIVADESEAPIPVAEAYAKPDEKDDDESTASDRAEARADIDVDQKLAERAVELFRQAMSKSSIPTLMRTMSLNLDVPGECYLVHWKGEWAARSLEEVRVAPGNDGYEFRLSAADATPQLVKKDQATVGRVWRPHPKHSRDPDSSLLGLRDDCEELMLLSRMIRVITRSKLNAGWAFVPDDITVVARVDEPDVESDEEQGDPLEQEMLAAMVETVSNEDAASTVVPSLLRGPAESGEKIRHILFERKSDEFLIARAERVLDRVLTSLDVPKDVVTGLANVKYANAVQIDESMYKAHVEPKAVLISDAVTDIVLHPLLRVEFPNEDIGRVVVWYDPSEVVTRPNRADDADRGYDKYLLSGASWRDAHGFSDNDAPDEKELAARLALTATIPPELATALFNALIPGVAKAAREANTEGGKLPEDLEKALGNNVPPIPDVESPPSGGGAESTGGSQ